MNKDDKEEERRKAACLSYVAYGIHSKFCNILKNEFKSVYDTTSFYIYEYFLAHPLVKGESLTEFSLFAPYLQRILQEKEFIPDIDDVIKTKRQWNEVKYKVTSPKNIKSFFQGNFGGTPFVVINTANQTEKHGQIIKDLLSKWQKSEDGDIVDTNKNFPHCDVIDYFNNIFGSKINEETRYSLLQEFLLVDHPWLSCEDSTKINLCVFSLSSHDIFFGELLIVYPEIKERDEKFRKLTDKIKKIIRDVYVPALLLFENMWEENKLEKDIQGNLIGTNYQYWEKFKLFQLSKTQNSLEKAFYELWKARKEMISSGNVDNKKEYILESLQFAKYNIGSPSLVEEIKKIALPREPQNKGGHLPCSLIIGGSGSGKDILAKIVQLFFPEYRFGKRYVINMASLKPGVLSVPLMSGCESEFISTGESGKSNSSSFQLMGIFTKIWMDFCKKNHIEALAEGEGLKNLKNNELEKKWRCLKKQGVLPVVILDELNSLDIDAQGALLRLLENREIQPLGSIERKEIDFLIVGMVNESEEVLSLDETLREIRENKLLGKLLSYYLYEKFRGMRRLRGDLYHRLIRDLKVTLKNIDERREDIPILFSHFVRMELHCEWDKFWIELDALETLMDLRFPWPGNFRQLQSIANKVVTLAKSSYNKEKNKVTIIKRKHVVEVMKEYGYKEEIL